TLALRQPLAGGIAGDTLLDLLDAGFGRSAGLALVSIATSAAVVNLVGLERILAWVSVGWHLGRSFVASHPLFRIRRRPIRVRPHAPNEPVILGPPPLPSPSSTRATNRRPVETPNDEQSSLNLERGTPEGERAALQAERGTTAWRRHDPSILGRATDGGSFSPAELNARARLI